MKYNRIETKTQIIVSLRGVLRSFSEGGRRSNPVIIAYGTGSPRSLSLPRHDTVYMHILPYKTELEALQHAARMLQTYFDAYKNQPVLFLSSGGSAFSVLEYVSTESISKHTTLSILDERYSHKPTINNFAQFSETAWFKKALSQGAQQIDTMPNMDETLEAFARRIGVAFDRWIHENEEGAIIATMGMGADGHTAGIMPYPEDEETFTRLFIQNEDMVVGYNAGDKNPYPERATVTIPFLTKNIRHAIMYCVGNDKQKAFTQLTALEGNLHTTPARVLHDMNDVKMYTTLSE